MTEQKNPDSDDRSWWARLLYPVQVIAADDLAEAIHRNADALEGSLARRYG